MRPFWNALFSLQRYNFFEIKTSLLRSSGIKRSFLQKKRLFCTSLPKKTYLCTLVTKTFNTQPMVEKLANRRWQVLKSEYIAREGNWFTVRKEHVRLPSGAEVPSWYIFEFPDWINVIALTDDDEFVIISQYRHAIGETHYELCAGVVDPTDASPLEAAKRELLEETGFGGGEWTAFMDLRPNPTNQTNTSYTFLAKGVKKIDTPHQESSEDIRTYLLSRAEVWELLQKGGFVQALHAAPLWKYFALEAL